MQYADGNPFGELEIRIYQRDNGEFLLYEDKEIILIINLEDNH